MFGEGQQAVIPVTMSHDELRMLLLQTIQSIQEKNTPHTPMHI